jgi:SH3-like domain-containing protein
MQASSVAIRGGAALLILAALCAAPAAALEYRSVGVPGAILYDAPSVKARKLFLLGKGYPVEILVTLEGWNKVRDATGELAWIEAKDLSSARMVMVKVARAEIRQAPQLDAPVLFQAEQDVLLEFIELAGPFARVRHPDGATGYVRVNEVWGL